MSGKDEGHLSRIARRKLTPPAGWEMCSLERIGTDGTLVKGGVPRLLKSGPRKGKKTWRDSELTTAVVTQSEIATEFAAYEASTGKCGECLGTAETWAGWSIDKGHRYSPCSHCGATGRAAASASPQSTAQEQNNHG